MPILINYEITSAFYLFHLFLFFLSIYYCMLITNWTVLSGESNKSIVTIQSESSFWIKSSSIYLTVILYIWVLVAPRILPNREFTF